jgi:hypothetical protein
LCDPTPPPTLLNLQQEHDSTENSQVMANSPLPSSPTAERKISIPDEFSVERPMSVRIIKQKQEQQIKTSLNGDAISHSPVLIESMLLLMSDQSQPPMVSFEQKQEPTNSSIIMNELERSRVMSGLEHSSVSNTCRRSATQRVHVPVHNASQWFNGPDMQNERIGRMEKVVASLVRRPYRPLSTYAYVI